ncbi:MAG: FMN-binding protein [candidate division Zixibacteria bacterium]|nr:FMN-binding protein [candidate division Zixibacteria bacterium]
MTTLVSYTVRVMFGVAASVLLLASAANSSDGPTPEEIGTVQVLQSDADALDEIFDDSDSTHCDTIVVSDSLRAMLESRLERTVRDSVYIAYYVFDDGAFMGYGIVSEERGKYRPITFMAGVSPDMHVIDVRVLVYRESRGGEVQRKRFLRQYRDKDLTDPLRINRDIINITGATISVRALNAGVRKALAVAEWLNRDVEGTQ